MGMYSCHSLNCVLHNPYVEVLTPSCFYCKELLQMQLVKVRSCRSRLGPKSSMTGKYVHSLVKINADIRMMQKQPRNVKDCNKVPQLEGRNRRDHTSQPSEGSLPTNTLILDFSTPELCDSKIKLFKTLSLLYSVIADLVN